MKQIALDNRTLFSALLSFGGMIALAMLFLTACALVLSVVCRITPSV